MVARNLHQRNAGLHWQGYTDQFRKGAIQERDVHLRIHCHHALHHAAQDGFQARTLALRGLHHHAHFPRGHFQRRSQRAHFISLRHERPLIAAASQQAFHATPHLARIAAHRPENDAGYGERHHPDEQCRHCQAAGAGMPEGQSQNDQ